MKRPVLADHVLVEMQVTKSRRGKLMFAESVSETHYCCDVCGLSWKAAETVLLRGGTRQPASGSKCPGAPIYPWEPWPAGMLTKKQLAAKKANPGPLAGVIPYAKSADGDGWLRLYREAEAIPKPALSEKRQAALEKAKAAAEAARHCSNCGSHLWGRDELRHQLCERCRLDLMAEEDRLSAGKVAYEMVCQADLRVWDSETTDLSGRFVEIAVVDQFGKVLFNERIRPGVLVEPGAYAVHGIRDEELASCPNFFEVYPALRQMLHGQHWAIYNAAFDTGILDNEVFYSNYRHWYAAQPIQPRRTTCMMELYASFYGDWHHYYKNYRWQKLDSYYKNHQAAAIDEPVPTIPTIGHHALVMPEIDIDDCLFRMLQPHEIGAAMAFPDDYIVLGNSRQKVRQYGNAVTPPVMRMIIERCVESLQ